MKILLSFLQDINEKPHQIPAYRFWNYYIKNGIEEAGMQWREISGIDWAEGLVHREGNSQLNIWKERVWAETLKYIKENRNNIDIFLCYLYPKQIDINAINEIRKQGIPCINFYCDNIREFTSPPEEFREFDLIWVPEFEALPMYKKAKINHIHLPMPIWTDSKYRTLPINENTSISFIGSKDYLRQNLLSEIIGKGLPIEIRGNGWDLRSSQKSAGVPVNLSDKLKNQVDFIRKLGLKDFIIYHLKRFEKTPDSNIAIQNIFDKPNFEEYVKITRESKVTLGINRVMTYRRLNKSSLLYSRLRDLEAPMLGACYLTEYTEGLSNLYDLGKEIETYSNADELLYKCQELISSKARRRDLRIQGQQRALNSHSITQSLQKLKLKLF